MLRVRGFTQDDAHIFCTPDQLADEIAGVCKLVDKVLTTFGFEYKAYLATRLSEKTIGDDDIWERGDRLLEEAAKIVGLELELDEAAAPSTAPRSTTRSRTPWDASGRTAPSSATSTCPSASTSNYTAPDGGLKRPIMVHRAILGSLERFVGGLIEHFGGKFPFWIAPSQVAVIPIREEHFALRPQASPSALESELFRVDAMLDVGHMNKKIKQAQKEQVPYMLIAGEREAEEGTVAVRRRGTREQVVVPFETFLTMIRSCGKSRSPSEHS